MNWKGKSQFFIHFHRCQFYGPCEWRVVAVRENGKCMHWHEICNKVKIQFEFEVTTERAHLLAHFSTDCFDRIDICLRNDNFRDGIVASSKRNCAEKT